MRGCSINIFLLDGDPNGIRVAQISMSTIQAIAFRKLQMRQVRTTFPELARPGVYILLGFDETQPDRLLAYIGQSECVAARLQVHAGNDRAGDSKTFWLETIAMVSKDENLTTTHARYVEARLIGDACRNPRWKLQNTQMPGEEGMLPLQERHAMEEFIDQTKTLVGALGCDLFKVIVSPARPTDTAAPLLDSFVFEFKGAGFVAHMMVTASGEIVVTNGSRARLRSTPTVPKHTAALRANLLASGILSAQQDALVFSKDYMFPSVSSAAAAVYGGSANGRISWRLPDGRTYADWEEGQNSP